KLTPYKKSISKLVSEEPIRRLGIAACADQVDSLHQVAQGDHHERLPVVQSPKALDIRVDRPSFGHEACPLFSPRHQWFFTRAWRKSSSNVGRSLARKSSPARPRRWPMMARISASAIRSVTTITASQRTQET